MHLAIIMLILHGMVDRNFTNPISAPLLWPLFGIGLSQKLREGKTQ